MRRKNSLLESFYTPIVCILSFTYSYYYKKIYFNLLNFFDIYVVKNNPHQVNGNNLICSRINIETYI